jgi:hypothetical protein
VLLAQEVHALSHGLADLVERLEPLLQILGEDRGPAGSLEPYPT